MIPVNIRKAEYIISSPSFEQCPAPDRAEFAFIGRSNVGKSSLINSVCRHDKLAKTSASPGKTQLINHFSVAAFDEKTGDSLRWYLVDLPGYGFAKVSQRDRNRWEQMIEHYLRKRENLVMVFVLIDSRHGPQKTDLGFLEKCRKWQVPVSIVFTKTDKENQRLVSKHVKEFFEAMRETWQFLPRYFLTSAVKKTGTKNLLEYVWELSADWPSSSAPLR